MAEHRTSKKPEERQAALALLIQNPSLSLSAVAREVGVSRQAVSLWMGQPEFQDALRKARNAANDAALFRLSQYTDKAIDTVVRELDSTGPSALRAAGIILAPIEYEKRVKDLEQREAEHTAFLDAFKRAVLEVATHEQAVKIRQRTEEILSGATATIDAP